MTFFSRNRSNFTEESYTSKASFQEDDTPTYQSGITNHTFSAENEKAGDVSLKKSYSNKCGYQGSGKYSTKRNPKGFHQWDSGGVFQA